ncbi:FAD binding domain-containing protein [Aspergillus aurantiobrunneus]
MDLTNGRSMELLRLLGLADLCRGLEGAVSPTEKFESMFVTSLGPEGKLLGKWSVGCVEEQRAAIERGNDGSQPVEPGQRCSQIVFEEWMRGLILRRDKVRFQGGWRYVGHVEEEDRVRARFVDGDGKEHTAIGAYLVGCDGGRSAVRKQAGIRMVGGQVPVRLYLVHFRSKHLASALRFGRFWHAFPAGGGFVIDQDGRDTFTAHYPLAEGESSASLDPREVVYRVLGGYAGRWEVDIDSVLVHSEWQPSFGIAEKYATDAGRVVLAGDAAHRSPPHGGYGLNSGIVDAVDLSWRLAAVMKGYGMGYLLKAYGIERRPMMMRALRRSHRHLMEHVGLGQLQGQHWDVLNSEGEKGEEARRRLEEYIGVSGPDTLDRGIEMDLRYEDSPCVWPDGSEGEPWDVKRYCPSTVPGRRAPHVFLRDGATSVYDLFGREWTLVQFAADGREADVSSLLEAAGRVGFPVKHVVLRNEEHARKIWERDLVLVRPDTHVAWRGNEAPELSEAEQILAVVAGRTIRPGYTEPSNSEESDQTASTTSRICTVRNSHPN